MSDGMTKQQRQDALARVPWITRMKRPRPCDGLRWNSMPSRALHRWGPGRKNPPTGVDKYRCKNTAYWKFTASKRHTATSGVYCWSHLWQQLYHMGEYERLRKWWRKQPEHLDRKANRE